MQKKIRNLILALLALLCLPAVHTSALELEDDALTALTLYEENINMWSNGTLLLSSEAKRFITAHPQWFSATNPGDIKDLYIAADLTVESKHIKKKSSQYLDTVVAVEGAITGISENSIGDGSMTLAWLYDETTYQQYSIIFFGSNDLYENDYGYALGLPVGEFSYANENGGWSSALLIIAGYFDGELPIKASLGLFEIFGGILP